MRTVSYTISPNLQQTLKQIEAIRARILISPLSHSVELKVRWEAACRRIYYSLHLSHSMVNQKQIVGALKNPGRRNMSDMEHEIVRYKKGFDYINSVWLMNSKPIMPQTLQTLYKITTDEKGKLPEQELMEILVFLQTSREHALIQAFIAYVQFTLSVPQDKSISKVARLLPYMFLYKAGLDFRGLLVLEKYFYEHERLMNELKLATERQEGITVWIEHFIDDTAKQLGETADNLEKNDKTDASGKIWSLTERQKDILSGFDQPGMRITNRKVQELFRISQITASRDLARLATLGLLFTYGKGRSVYYMRA